MAVDPYDIAREAYERKEYIKRGSYTAQRIAKGVRTINPVTPRLDAELSQVNTLPPEFCEDRKRES